MAHHLPEFTGAFFLVFTVGPTVVEPGPRPGRRFGAGVGLPAAHPGDG